MILNKPAFIDLVNAPTGFDTVEEILAWCHAAINQAAVGQYYYPFLDAERQSLSSLVSDYDGSGVYRMSGRYSLVASASLQTSAMYKWKGVLNSISGEVPASLYIPPVA